jgi:hypothetical protein
VTSSVLWRSSIRESEYTLLGPGRDCEDASENLSSAKVVGELDSIVDDTMDEATVDGNATLPLSSCKVVLEAAEIEIGGVENRLVIMPDD